MPKTYFDYFAPAQAGPVGAPPKPIAPTSGGAPAPLARGGEGNPPPPPPPPAPNPNPNPNPNPGGGPPPPPAGGGTFDPVWLSANIDDRITPEQWTAWKDFWDAAQAARDPGHPFKSENVDQYGQPIQGFFEKPVDCPVGTTKYGVNQCLPLDHPKVLGVRPGAQPGPTPAPTPGTSNFDMQNFLSRILPLLLNFYGPQQAHGSFLPGTQTQLNSSQPFNPYAGMF